MNYPDFLRREWRFLNFAFALTFFSSLGQTYFISVFGGEIRDTFTITDGDFGLIYMIATLTSAVLLSTLGRAIDVIDLRLWTLLVCSAAIGACFLMSIATGLGLLVLGIFAVRLTGQGLMGHTAFTSMGRYYDAHRGKALSIAALGFAAGSGVFPRFAVWLLEQFTWREAWFALGVGLACFLVPYALWLLRGHTERHRRLQERATADHDLRQARAAGPGDDDDSPQQWTRAQVLRDARFYLLLPAVLSPTFILTGFIFHQVRLAESKGWSLEMLTAAFVPFAIVQSAASLYLGARVDRLGARKLARLYLIPLALGMAVLALFDAPGAAWVYMVLAGATAGAAAPISGSLWAEMYGVLHLGSIRALSSSLMIVSTALAPFVLGWLMDRGVRLETLAWGSFAYVLLGLILIALALARPTPRPR